MKKQKGMVEGRVPPQFDVERKGKRGAGLYNGHLLFCLLLLFFARPWISLAALVSLALAIVLDPKRPKGRGVFDPVALVTQLELYVKLLGHVLVDNVAFWAGTALLMPLFQPVRQLLHDNLLFEFPGTGVFLFGTYLVVRTVYVVLHPSRATLWAYFLGHVGLLVRCFRLDVMEAVLLKVPAVVQWDTSWLAIGCYFAVVTGWSLICMRVPGRGVGDDYLYYKLHKTLHNVPALFAFAHGLHHQAVLPTLLDSGTIGPPELVITETHGISIAVVLWPYPVSYGWEVVHMALHYIGHETNGRWQKIGAHHLLHHKKPSVNFGIHTELDKYYQTFEE